MGLVAEKITGVVATGLAGGIWADGKATEEIRSALVEWKSTWEDKFYQVYVNGYFAGATVDSEQRRMIVFLPSSFGSSVRIEVFAVDAAEADIDFGDELASSRGQSGRVRLRILRSQDLPAESGVEIYSDNGVSHLDDGSGQIDYDKPENLEPIPIWPVWQEKCGFGLSEFGESDFGRDWSPGVGFGAGLFGQGEFGVDADVIEWVSGELAAGKYKFGIRIIDGNGNISEASETREIIVLPAAKGVEDLQVVSYDGIENNLELRIKD
jgi:hypothetical protein